MTTSVCGKNIFHNQNADEWWLLKQIHIYTFVCALCDEDWCVLMMIGRMYSTDKLTKDSWLPSYYTIANVNVVQVHNIYVCLQPFVSLRAIDEVIHQSPQWKHIFYMFKKWHCLSIEAKSQSYDVYVLCCAVDSHFSIIWLHTIAYRTCEQRRQSVFTDQTALYFWYFSIAFKTHMSIAFDWWHFLIRIKRMLCMHILQCARVSFQKSGTAKW